MANYREIVTKKKPKKTSHLTQVNRATQKEQEAEEQEDLEKLFDHLQDRDAEIEDQIEDLRGSFRVESFTCNRKTTESGVTTWVIPIKGVKEKMNMTAGVHTEGTNTGVTIKERFTGKDEITIVFSADPGADKIVEYSIFYCL